MKQVLVLMRRHGHLLMYFLVLSTGLIIFNAHTAKALLEIDPQGLLRDLSPGNLLGQEKPVKPAAVDKKSDSSDSKASPHQTNPSSPTASRSPASSSARDVSVPVQQSASELTPLPTIDTPLTPYPYPDLSRGLLVNSRAAVPVAAVGESSAPILAASSQGWKVAGLAWYWWLIALALVAVAGRWGLYRLQRARRVE